MFSLKRNPVLLGVATFILLVIVFLAQREFQRYSDANADARRTREALDAVWRVLANTLDAETGQRGYVLTGEDRYQEPYNRAIQALPGEMAHLTELVAGRPSELALVQELNRLLGLKLEALRQAVELRQTRGGPPAIGVVITDQGKLVMDEIRATCAEIRGQELTAWREAASEREAAARTTLLITLGGSLALLVLFTVGIDPVIAIDVRGGRSPLQVYGVAVLATAAGVLLRMALTPLLGATAVPFITFFPVVLFVSWYGGFRAGALSVVLSGLAANYYFVKPIGSFSMTEPGDQVSFIVFVLVGLGIALQGHSQKTAVELARQETVQRRVAEGAERDQRRRFETTLASIGDAVVATDAEGRVVFSNKVAQSLLRASEAELAGSRLDDVFRIVNEFTRESVESPVARVLREGMIVGLANHTILIAQDGTEVPIDDSGAPIRGEDGQIRGTVLVFRDITGRRQAERDHLELAAREKALAIEEALREKDSELARVTRALTAGELSISIAHEINQPLAGVVTNAEACLRWLGGETPNLDEARESLRYIVRDGARASEVIQRIRALLTKEPPRFEPLDINRKVEDALALAQRALARNQVVARLDLSEALPPVLGDRTQLQQVILNLISNASEAMASMAGGPRELLLSTRRSDDGAIHVAVRDSGPGAGGADLERMFDPFYTTKSKGIGMGLSISRSIIEAHKGRIWASAVAERPGLTVQFTVPAHLGKAASAP